MELFLEQYGMMLFWGVIAALSLIVEVNTADMISIWFTPGAIVSMILSVWVKPFWIQLLVFVGLSVICLSVTRVYFKKHPFRGKAEKMNADALIGKSAIVQEEIDNTLGTGSVKLGALIWTARSADDAVTIPVGAVVTVCEIRGVKAICEPTGQEPAKN